MSAGVRTREGKHTPAVACAAGGGGRHRAIVPHLNEVRGRQVQNSRRPNSRQHLDEPRAIEGALQPL